MKDKKRENIADLLANVPLSMPSKDIKTLLEEYRAQHPGPSSMWVSESSEYDKHQLAALKYAQGPHHTRVREKTLGDFSNAELVMEMLSRGFAVMKLPEGGGPPEVLRSE